MPCLPMTAEDTLTKALQDLAAEYDGYIHPPLLLAALDAAGFVVVPKVATEAMLQAPFNSTLADIPPTKRDLVEVYRSMLAARPR